MTTSKDLHGLMKHEAALVEEARANEQRGEIEAAVAIYDRLIEQGGENPYLFARRGVARFDLKRFREAIEDFNRSLLVKPVAPTTLTWRARSWESLGQLDRAMADYRASAEMDPGSAEVWTSMGLIHQYRSEPEKAEQCYRRALEIDGSDDVALRGLEDLRARAHGPL